MNAIHISHRLLRRCGMAAAGLALVAFCLLVSQAPPAQASLYWASASGVADLTTGVRSSTPSLCFVGDAVTSRLPRVAQIIEYLKEYENVSSIRFVSPISHLKLSDELAAGHLDMLTCPAPVTVNGRDWFDGDIRMVIPATSVVATDPVPGNGCMTDKMKSAPSCVARDSSHIDCYARGVDDKTWGKHWDATNGWGDWESALGGITDAAPAVASLNSSNLEVVARGVGDNALYIKTWDGTNWTANWTQIPGTSGNTTGGAACVGHDGHHLSCVARWINGHIYFADRDSGTWSAWRDTGLDSNFAPGISSWGNNRVDVFANGANGSGETDNLIHVWTSDNGVNWNGWVEDLDGDLKDAPACIGRNGHTGSWGWTGDLDCFGRGADNSAWQRTFHPDSNSWSAWIDRGGVIIDAPGVASLASSKLDLFVIGTNGSLWQKSSTDGGTTWGGFADRGDNSGWGSWSAAPWSLNEPTSRACTYNLKLGDNPWCPVGGEYWPCASNPEIVPYRDHTLHEVGHALGLAHEHVRADANVPGCGAGYGGGVTQGYITPYDRDSVMHYMFASCGIPGNYDYSGLSYYDRVAVHILYPPAGFPAEIVGDLGIKTGEVLTLSSAWKAWGANISFAASNFVWKVDGITQSTTPDLSLAGLSAGDHTVTLDHDDFLGRHHSGSWKVHVMTPQEYTAAVVEGGALTPLYLPIYAEMFPIVTR